MLADTGTLGRGLAWCGGMIQSCKSTARAGDVSADLMSTNRSTVEKADAYLRIIVIATCSDCWKLVDQFFWDGFGFGVEFVHTPSELRGLLLQNKDVDFFVLPSVKEILVAYEAAVKDFRECFKNSSCVIDAVHRPLHWITPQNFGAVAAIFNSDLKCDDIISRFARLAFDKWQRKWQTKDFARETAETNVVGVESDGASASAKSVIVDAAQLRAVINAKQKILGPLGADPIFDILLEIYHAHLIGEQVDFTALGAQLQLPMSTFSRKVDYLVDRQIVRRSKDDEDRRRCKIVMLPKGVAKMEAYMGALNALSI